MANQVRNRTAEIWREIRSTTNLNSSDRDIPSDNAPEFNEWLFLLTETKWLLSTGA